MKRVSRFLLRALALILALALCLIFMIAVYPQTETLDLRPVDGSADWMARLDDDLPLNRIVLPGTHDSATQYVQLAFFSRCQSMSIGEQLEAGFRYLDIRLGIDEKTGDLILMHGFTHCKTGLAGGALRLGAVLEQCYAFLDAHPTETIAFSVKQEHGSESVAEFEAALHAAASQNAGRWLPTDTIPALGEARGRIVLLRRYPDPAELGASAGVPLRWAEQSGHDDVSLHTAASDNGSYTLWVQDRFSYGAEDKWTAFLSGMAAAGRRDDELAIHFLSTKGTAAYGHPFRFAKALNPQLLATDAASLSGWIVLDFATPQLAEHVYSANF